MSNKKVYLEAGTAWTIEDGKRKGVQTIEVPVNDDCCKLDCCNGVLTYKSPLYGTYVTISLDAIAIAQGVIPAPSSSAPPPPSSSTAPPPSSSAPPPSSSNTPGPSSSAPPPSSSGV